MGIKVAKFGGSSVADGIQLAKMREIIEQDADRKYIIVSAPGKRFPSDTKVTDLLYLCMTQKENNIPAGATVFTGTSQPGTTTRTAILNHTKGSGASVNWSSSDKIWVKDDAGTWQQSTAAIIPSSTNQSFAKFALSGTFTGTSHDILYTNKGVAGSQAQVEIKAEQTQSAPNNFDHAGESGDCGVATGSRVGSGYNFTLNHKAAYLCFIPRSSNPYVNRSKLIKVEIMSDDDIAGTYDIAADGTLTLASGGSKTITVTTGSGFAIDNSTEDMSKNATYAVVAPGTHTFRIRYWLRNTVDNPSGTIEGTVSKYITLNCTAGSINDITANLAPRDYDGTKYYMWDAKKDCWYGYESVQPSVILTTNPNYPKTATDIRWYNPTAGNATNSSAICHNINELIWYTMKGDPHWDGTSLWSLKGHLHIGGMWLLKHSAITGFSTEKYGTKDYRLETNGANVRINNTNVTAGKPANTTNYFYTPATGYYDRTDGTYRGSGDNPLYVQGYVWSSTTSLDQNGSGSYSLAYYMAFGSGGIYTNFMWKSTGFPNSLDD